MGIFRQFPYTNFHDMNMDWLLNEFNELINTWKEYNENWENWMNDVNATIEEFRTLIDQEHISVYLREIIDKMIEDGEFQDILAAMLNNEFIDGDYNITRFTNAADQSTFVYWRKIPKEYEPYLAYSEIGTRSPIAMSAETGACSAVNGSRWDTATGAFYGYFRANGQTINNNEFEDTEVDTNSRNILCFKNGLLSSKDIRTSTEVLDGENYEWALVGFETIIENSLPKPRATAGGPDETTDLHPRSFIAQTLAGDYIIGSCDGRSGRSEGFRLSDITRFLISLNENITYAYSLDGGGSVCLYEKGYHVNSYINNEHRDVKSTICFKKPDGYYSDVLKQAVTNDENIYRGRKNNYEYMQGNIYAYADNPTKGIEFSSLSNLVSQAFIRMQQERFFVGVDNDFSNSGEAHTLLDISDSNFQWNGILRAMVRLINDTADYVDTIPNIGQTQVNCIQFTSGAAAQNAGLSTSDYGMCIMITFRTNGTYTIILTRSNIWFRWDNEAFRRVMFES